MYRLACKQKTGPCHKYRALRKVMVPVNCGINFEGLLIEWPFLLNSSWSNLMYRCKAVLSLVSNYHSIGGEVTVDIFDGWEWSVFSYHLFHAQGKSSLPLPGPVGVPQAGIDIVIREYSYEESNRGHPARGYWHITKFLWNINRVSPLTFVAWGWVGDHEASLRQYELHFSNDRYVQIIELNHFPRFLEFLLSYRYVCS